MGAQLTETVSNRDEGSLGRGSCPPRYHASMPAPPTERHALERERVELLRQMAACRPEAPISSRDTSQGVPAVRNAQPGPKSGAQRQAAWRARQAPERLWHEAHERMARLRKPRSSGHRPALTGTDPSPGTDRHRLGPSPQTRYRVSLWISSRSTETAPQHFRGSPDSAPSEVTFRAPIPGRIESIDGPAFWPQPASRSTARQSYPSPRPPLSARRSNPPPSDRRDGPAEETQNMDPAFARTSCYKKRSDADSA